MIRPWLALALLCLAGCEKADDPAMPSAVETAGYFHDVTRELGIDFEHQDGRSGRRFYVETSASGGGFLDYDADGDLDLYLVNGARTPSSPLANDPRNALYENRQGRFVDVTDQTHTGDMGYGMGLCVADYDADGQLDFLVTNYGRDRLYRGVRQADGTVFEDATESAGILGERWGTNCAFGDVDGDGDLDLYVANYVGFTYENNPRCGDAVRDAWSYCRPDVFDGQADQLYIHQGFDVEGRVFFREEGAARGILQGTDEKGYGVLINDFDGDGDADIAVANDGTPNRLYINDGRGHFTDRALLAGLAVNRDGAAESGMGMDWGDVDGDGREDLVVTNYSFETHTLYRQRDPLFFEDATFEVGLHSASYLPVGWGVRLFDLDNDADLDLAIANGHVLDTIDLFEDGIGYPQPNSLFVNEDGRFREASSNGGTAFASARVSRGLAVGDFDNDGRLDLLITNTNDRAELLRNTIHNPHHWLGLRLRGPAPNPLAIGARASVRCGGKDIGRREVRSGGSFLSQSDLRLHFGLASCTGPVEATIHWPDGHVQYRGFETTELDRYLLISHPRLRHLSEEAP